jgi:hypothetical protein
MSLLDQNWGDIGGADDDALDDNQRGRQVEFNLFFYYLRKTI